jgi:hypothetical protein
VYNNNCGRLRNRSKGRKEAAIWDDTTDLHTKYIEARELLIMNELNYSKEVETFRLIIP